MDYDQDEKLRIRLQHFAGKLNALPDPNEFEPTQDGKARTLPISFIEMTLDELFFGLWETSDPQYQQVFNEVIATVTLTVTHPVTGKPLKRVGWASVVITQDKDAQISEFNMTKKKNALDLAFPKLGAEAVKNAAKSLGKIFGRDINRKKTDSFKPPLKALGDAGFNDLLKRVEQGEHTLIPLAESNFLLDSTQKSILEGFKAEPKKIGNG